MKIVVNAAQAKQQDADYMGDLAAVMDRAGYAVASQAAGMGVGYGSRVAVLCGSGNNGGDGYVAARYLKRRGIHVTCAALAAPTTALSKAAADSWHDVGGTVGELATPIAADLVIDALFGVGFRGDLPPELAAWSDHPAPVLAVDVVSGLDATSGDVAVGALAAAQTVALSNFKVGHFFGRGPDVSGALALANLGLPDPAAAMYLCEADDAPRPERERTAHKWSAGAVAVLGGSAGLAGAAVLAAKSALGFGAGAVATFVPGALAAELDAAHPEIMTHGVGTGASLASCDPGALAAELERFDVVVVGPGMGPDVGRFATAALDAIPNPVVLDADGLNAVDASHVAARAGEIVLTPHAGEFARLAGAPATPDHAAELAASTGATVLLKGPATLVASSGAVPWIVASGGRELATVGTGDVLAGMIGALIARGLAPHVAARSAAYWHGVAGASLAATSSVTADRLVEEVRRFAN